MTKNGPPRKLKKKIKKIESKLKEKLAHWPVIKKILEVNGLKNNQDRPKE